MASSIAPRASTIFDIKLVTLISEVASRLSSVKYLL
jgi:hypothetical protein